MRNTKKMLVGKPQVKTTLGTLRYRQADDIKMNCREME
jgi:hypothetical protein